MSTNDCGAQDNNEYTNNVICTDMSKELMEEEDLETARPETGLTEVRIQIEGKEVKTLVDTGSEISVISEHILESLQEINKNIPILPVAGVTIVGITGAVSYTHLDVYKRQVYYRTKRLCFVSVLKQHSPIVK